MQSRYYDPELGRFINADAFASTAQGVLGHNVYAYCLNNPVNFVDSNGKNATALQAWSASMWWLCAIDFALPIGDLIYAGVAAVLTVAVLSEIQDNRSATVANDGNTAPSPPSPNNDDDEDDDYYNDDSNFGGRQKVGKTKGKTPGNNQRQNKQFKDATKGLTKAQQRALHNKISGKGLGFHDIAEAAKYPFGATIGIFTLDDLQ